jgi:hypothetical protein
VHSSSRAMQQSYGGMVSCRMQLLQTAYEACAVHTHMLHPTVAVLQLAVHKDNRCRHRTRVQRW